MKSLITCVVAIWPALLWACDLCSISSADSARREGAKGPILTLSEQFVPFSDLQVNGEPYPGSTMLHQAFYDRFITHLVPGYNFSRSFGLSLNVPYVYGDFRRVEVTPLGEFVDEKGTVSGLGDLSLIGRWSVLQKQGADYDATVNLLAGVKFPTGDTDRLEDERVNELRYLKLFGPIHAHALGGIHQHDLSPGTGSFDGIFGASANLRWQRIFFFAQFQYYLRTEAIDYEMGDLTIVSGGPGVFLVQNKDVTLSLLANVFYENQLPDEAFGQPNNQTGLSAWYMGPQVAFSWGKHFSMNAGADLPLVIWNRGIQSVPEYRVHGGLNWKF